MVTQFAAPLVLCVDDNPDAADSTADLLSLVGFDCRSCYNAYFAVEFALKFQPHACLLDLNMPVMDGYELAGRLRRVLGRVLLVALSAATGATHERRFAAAGFDAQLRKPADLADMMGVLSPASV